MSEGFLVLLPCLVHPPASIPSLLSCRARATSIARCGRRCVCFVSSGGAFSVGCRGLVTWHLPRLVFPFFYITCSLAAPPPRAVGRVATLDDTCPADQWRRRSPSPPSPSGPHPSFSLERRARRARQMARVAPRSSGQAVGAEADRWPSDGQLRVPRWGMGAVWGEERRWRRVEP